MHADQLPSHLADMIQNGVPLALGLIQPKVLTHAFRICPKGTGRITRARWIHPRIVFEAPGCTEGRDSEAGIVKATRPIVASMVVAGGERQRDSD